MSIGSRIREERKKQKLTLRSLSEKADISISYLGDIEKERSHPSVSRLMDLAEALGKTTAYFLEEEKAAEEESVFLTMNRDERINLIKLLKTEGFKEIVWEFQGFEDWNEREKEELRMFLNTRRTFSIK